ncbi:MAG: hypothetical protein DMG46_06295 [Acidobacteria bacterium]|nr:MAG: hypothetical protein DMG46_06295 [Acidobacteriota bacterium]
MSTRGKQFPIMRFCFALIVGLVFACGAFAQSTTDGAIGGTVTDSSGAAVPNARVVVKSNGTNAEEIAMTDDTGYFRVGKLQPATYTVTVDVPGFAPFGFGRRNSSRIFGFAAGQHNFGRVRARR